MAAAAAASLRLAPLACSRHRASDGGTSRPGAARWSARSGALLVETLLQLAAREERRARHAWHRRLHARQAALFAIDHDDDGRDRVAGLPTAIDRVERGRSGGDDVV